jgi:phosphoribosylformylglycinamidine (FGAM) synthase-like enzyme
MTTSNVADILIAIAVLVWVIYRQLTWQLVNPSRLWRMPIIVAVVGIIMLAQTKSLNNITAIDLAIFAGELVFALGIGAAMGSLARFRSRPQRASDVASRRDSGATFNPAITVVESRTGGLGAALLLVLIVVRIGIEIAVTQYSHSAFLASTGTILIVLAANRAARALVVSRRMEQSVVVAA